MSLPFRRVPPRAVSLSASLIVLALLSATAAAAPVRAPLEQWPQSSRDRSGGLDGFVCGLAKAVEPIDDHDFLDAVFDFLDEGDVKWASFGAFALVEAIKQLTCPSPQAMSGLSRLRPLFPPLPSLAVQRTTPGYVMLPTVSIASAVRFGTLGVMAGVKVSWISGGEQPVSAVDLRQDPSGTVTHLTGPSNPGTYYIKVARYLVLGEWYQYALRVDDSYGVSEWVCTQPFMVSSEHGSYYWQTALDSAATLNVWCGPSTVATH
jgi:hypothetical protein